MSTCRVLSNVLHRAALLLAFVLIARLRLVTNLLAFESLCLSDLFIGHDTLLNVVWIVNLVARHQALVFTTGTILFDHYFTSLAFIIVARFCTLMFTTG